MKLWSDSFKNGAAIPGQYAFAAGANKNPHLAWSDVPSGTESLVLLCIDGDAPTDGTHVNQKGHTLPATMPRADFFHWSLIDIPPTRSSIAAGEFSQDVTPKGKPASLPAPLRHGINDYTSWFAGDKDLAGDYYGYDGPCPPWNDERTHHYVFRLYALDTARLGLEGRFTCQDVLQALHGHILDEAQVIGTYSLFE